MDLYELTQEMQHFVESKGWYQESSKRPQSPQNLAISLVLEAAEVLEHFQWTTAVTDRAALAEELADVALYLLQIASITQIDLEAAILNKLRQNADRSWEPEDD